MTKATENVHREWRPGVDQIPDAFFQIPVYSGWPNAWPEDPNAVRYQFSPANEYFKDGKAWLGLIPGRARVAGFWKPDQEFAGKKVAYFGFWETLDDRDANRELFAQLRRWAKEQGADTLVGPVNFSTFGNYRIRVGGQPSDDILAGEPFNPPYYEKLLAELGLQPAMRYESVTLPVTEAFTQFLKDKTQDGKHPAYEQFRIKSLDAETWQRRLPEFHELTMTFFQGAAGFKPIALETFRQVYGPIIGVRQCPHSTFYVTTPEDRIIAYFLCFPNYGAVIRRDAEFKPLSGAELTFAKAFPLMKNPNLVAKTIGIHPDFRGRGLQHVFMAEAIQRGIVKGYKSVTYALMREGNPSNNLYPNLPLDRRYYLLYAEALEGR